MKFIARFLGMLSLVLSVPAYAQMVRITGTVTDAKTREALPSARVTVGSTKVVTDLDHFGGSFCVRAIPS
jgi:hypothetical protein